MKRLILPWLALLLTGCVIHSIDPFCTEKSQVEPKELLGKWQLWRSAGEDVSAKKITPWTLESGTGKTCKLSTFDDKDAGAEFEVTFFKLGDDWFLDFTPEKVAEETKLNSYWAFAVHPTHGVCKVMMETNELRLIPLSYDWVTDGVKKKELTLPYVGKLDDCPLFTASPEQWETLLRKNASNTNAFPAKTAFVLKRPVAKQP